MSHAQVQTELSTADGFARRVVVARPAVKIAQGLIAVAAIALAYNAFSTFRTMADYPGAGFFEIFISTQGDNPVSTIWFTLLVWAPIVVLPLALIFFVYARTTAQRVEHEAYQQFTAGGHVATQHPTAFAALVPNGNATTQTPVYVLSHPAVTPEATAQAVAAINAHVATLDKKAAKTLAKSVGKVLAKFPPAADIVAGLPPQLLLTGAIGKTEWVAVVPDAAGAAAPRHFAVKP